ncbi:hypothetical protein A6R68_20708 [Neotoma lepida]|uniref:Uncharacterized protein n=1 Tax=Neotoma lepida TaxID=56216 RepID=A0A1A6HRI0_NEOLE|nr:hypothetical protein A6R68_20708 [Neotoma lepida]
MAGGSAMAVTMAHYKATDSKQFRRYLEKSEWGVLDTLTEVLAALYEEPEKPTKVAVSLQGLSVGGRDPIRGRTDVISSQSCPCLSRLQRISSSLSFLRSARPVLLASGSGQARGGSLPRNMQCPVPVPGVARARDLV